MALKPAKTFEELEIWRDACRLSLAVHILTNTGEFGHDYAFRDHLRKSSISIPSNIAEGFERGSNREFARFLWIAKGSEGELRTQLYLAVKLDYITMIKAKPVLTQCKILSKRIAKLIVYLQTHTKPATCNSKNKTFKKRRKI